MHRLILDAEIRHHKNKGLYMYRVLSFLTLREDCNSGPKHIVLNPSLVVDILSTFWMS